MSGHMLLHGHVLQIHVRTQWFGICTTLWHCSCRVFSIQPLPLCFRCCGQTLARNTSSLTCTTVHIHVRMRDKIGKSSNTQSEELAACSLTNWPLVHEDLRFSVSVVGETVCEVLPCERGATCCVREHNHPVFNHQKTRTRDPQKTVRVREREWDREREKEKCVIFGLDLCACA